MIMMISKVPTKYNRTTKYIAAVRRLMKRAGHATNVELIEKLRKEFPDVSATTLHRITSRMVERNDLQLAPPGIGNVMRFDANTTNHDHFMCTNCRMLKDANLRTSIVPQIEHIIGDDCTILGRLTVTGLCKKCAKLVG